MPDKSRCRLPAHLLLERDAALQRGLQPSVFFEDRHRALKDRPLDAGEFFTNPGVGFDAAGRFAPAAEDRIGPVELVVRADARDDLDGALALG